MKLGLMKRLIATGLCAAMLFGDVLPVAAAGSVSGGDAAVAESVNTVSANDAEVIAEIEPVQMEELMLVEDAVWAEESVSGNELTEIEEDEIPLNDSIEVSLDPVTVDGVTITVSGPASAFAEGTTVSAVEVDPAEVVIAAAEENEQATVKKYKAFDINLICDGEVVQPLNGAEIKVNFEGDMLIPDVENNEDVAVYHVDENDNITKMDAAVAPLETEETVAAETVEMTTTHFSTYVVVITSGQTEFEITYRHFADVNGDGTPEEFYKPYTETIEVNNKITYSDFKKAGIAAGGDDYTISSVRIDYADGNINDINIDIAAANPAEVTAEIESDATIYLYYSPVVKNTNGNRYENDVVFYDYYVYGNNKQYGINEEFGKYYQIRNNGGWINGQRVSASDAMKKVESYLAMGGVSDRPYSADINLEVLENEKNANNYTGTLNGNANYYQGGNDGNIVVQGIVEGLTNNMQDVDWGKTRYGNQTYDIWEPGYFTSEEWDCDTNGDGSDDAPAKKIYYTGKDNANSYYKLNFDQTGHRYQLYSAKINEGNQEYETLVRCTVDENYDNHNYKAGDISGQFFPLNNVAAAQYETCYGIQQNCFFGMRYDFSFKLGEYIGPLEYTFEGDDDLWVFVDGELVLDLGGIHSAFPSGRPEYANSKVSNTVDLWETYFGVSTTGDEWWKALDGNAKYDPNHEYQVTVLYMERGNFASTCYMDFTLPNVESRIVTEKYGSLTFDKVDEYTNDPVSGAEFSLYKVEVENGVERETFVRKETSNATGEVHFGNLTAGKYYLKETDAPEGYEETTAKWVVQVNKIVENAEVTITVDLLDDKGAKITAITNKPIIDPIDAEFTKVDLYKNSKTLEGATFTLNQDGKVLQTVTSGADGKIKFTGLEEGVYTIEETKAPTGYVVSDSKWTLTVTLNKPEKKYEYTITGEGVKDNLLMNEPYVGFEFTKVDSETGESIDGAGFTLYKGLSDSKTETVATATSDTDGKVKFENLRAGQDYLLVETETPYGYVEPTTPWVIRVDYENGNFVQKSFTAKLDSVTNTWKYDNSDRMIEADVIKNDPAYGSLKIIKTVNEIDFAYGTPSFTFKIEGPNRAVYYGVITFDNANEKVKTIVIKDLPVGDYTVTEMDSLQYKLISADTDSKEVTGNVNPPEFKFVNKLDGDGYSHSDVVVNSFRRNENGEIEISKNREVIE